MLLGDILRHNAKVLPNKNAIIYKDESVSYRDLLFNAKRFSGIFSSLGVNRGEPIAVLMENSARYVEIMFGAMIMGAVHVPLNFYLVPRELEAIVKDLSPRYLLFSSKFAGVAAHIMGCTDTIAGAFCVDGESEHYAPLPDKAGEGEVEATHTDDDVAMIIYGATTGLLPKGVMLSHNNLMCASYFSAIELNISRRDVYLSTFPLPFLAGTGRMLKFLLAGAEVVIMEDFQPDRALRLIEEKRVTQLLLIPQTMSAILEEGRMREYDTSSLKTICYSGIVPVDMKLIEDFVSFFRCDFVQSFAQVESSGIISFLHFTDTEDMDGGVSRRVLSSVGKESIGISVRVIDDSGYAVEEGMIGELAVRGPTVMKGYLNDPFLTDEKLRKGWLHTGYAASIDGDGFIYIIDRLKETIIRGGMLIDPEEVEQVLSAHPSIKEVACVGRPDTEQGEVPVALAVIRDGARKDEKEIMRYAEENLAPFKIPAAIEFVDALPRNSLGKILKARVKEKLS